MRFTATVGSITHYSGPLDYAIVRIQRPSQPLTSRVFPCLLNTVGYQQAVQRRAQAVLVARSRSNQRLRAHQRNTLSLLPARIVTKPCVDDMLCLQLHNAHAQYNRTVYDSSELPVFVKVGTSRWALAGFGDVKRYGNLLSTPLHGLINWAYRHVR